MCVCVCLCDILYTYYIYIHIYMYMHMYIYIYIFLIYTCLHIYIRILKYRESLYPSPHKFLPHSLRHCRRTVCRSISIHEELEKAVMSEKMTLILKSRTQMVENIYKYFNLDLSESHRAKLYICTLLDPRLFIDVSRN